MRKSARMFVLALMMTPLLLLMVVPHAWAAEPPPTEWERTFGGTGYEFAYSAQQTSDGGYITAGKTTSYGAGSDDAWLVKTDSAGNKTWERTFGGTGSDIAYSAQQTTDGGYILAGETSSYGSGFKYPWLIKTDSAGNKIWDRTFGGAITGIVYSVQQTPDGGYVIAGNASDDGCLIKTDSAGNEIWVRTFGGTGSDTAYSAQRTTDGGYIIGGFTTSYGAGHYDAWLIKTDSAGNKIWDRTFGGADYDAAFSVQQTSDGGYVFAGYVTYTSGGYWEAWLVKVDSSGNKMWDNTFGTGLALSVQQTPDGGYILAGVTVVPETGIDASLIKTDTYGNKAWDKTFGGTMQDIAYSVQRTSDSGCIVAGYTNSYGADLYDYDALLIKVAPFAPPPPTVTGITPKSCVQGSSVNITDLAGANFQNGATVRIEKVGGTQVYNATKVVVSPTRITCTINLAGAGAPLGKYDVVVRNPDGQEGRLAGGFSVTNACGGGGGAVALGLGLMMGLLSLVGFGRSRRRLKSC